MGHPGVPQLRKTGHCEMNYKNGCGHSGQRKRGCNKRGACKRERTRANADKRRFQAL